MGQREDLMTAIGLAALAFEKTVRPRFDATGLQERIDGFCAGVAVLIDEHYRRCYDSLTRPAIVQSVGPRYVKIIMKRDQDLQGSLYCFIDRANGNILKGSWKAPVRNGVRGNIFNPGYDLDKCDWHGPKYLR